MDIHTLLHHYHSRFQQLVVPADERATTRYDEAKQEVTEWVVDEGSGHQSHRCGFCSPVTYNAEDDQTTGIHSTKTLFTWLL